jgi:hypothetical protein
MSINTKVQTEPDDHDDDELENSSVCTYFIEGCYCCDMWTSHIGEKREPIVFSFLLTICADEEEQ